ncbi:MAG: SPOR domain-containing protein [Daejeonella sp.]
MDIGFYMTDLLRDQDEVSLPGLGTFTNVRVPGSYDQTTNSFLPPGHRVSFSNVPSEYNSLSEYISSKKNLSHSSAEYFVKNFTSVLLDLLRTAGIAEIKPLGILRQKDEGLIFEASGNIDVSGRFYGLKPISDQEKTSFPPAAAVIIEGAIPAQKEETLAEPEIEGDENRSNPWIPGVFLFLLIGAGLLYAFNPVVKNFVQGLFSPAVSNSGIPVSDTLNKNTPASIPDSASTETGVLFTDSALTDSSALSQTTAPPEPDPVTYSEPTYEIIGVVFQKKAEADAYIKKLAAKGIPAKIAMQIPGKLIKVSLGSFTDEESALIELRRIHKQINKEAWIYRPKLKKTQ